ncbi:MAG: hypothetical protein JO297_08960 [Nitrososphaeraceae archaeon]|nr:hypothetical protein [Nitrososphaeraceae archaeon]
MMDFKKIIEETNEENISINLSMPDGRKLTKTVREVAEKLNSLRKQGLLFQHGSGALFLIQKGKADRNRTYYDVTNNISKFLGYVFDDETPASG